ncbi:MAG: ChaN family lipoprotein, partial [Deltaproteobacteria bacterium]|nr:ChaN family lipoprotein [Deltaproteobacteria bacterium]
MSPREELIKIQKQIFRKNQKIIEESILVSEQGFAKYEQDYLRHVKNFRSIAGIDDLKQALVKADWIYLGDYHTNRQSQRALLRLLKMLIGQTDRFVLCLEFLQKRHQPHADRYLAGKISLTRFLKLINLRKHFYFDLWENFEPIFDFAKYYQLGVYGIEAAPFGAGLKKRDEAMAKTLAEVHALHPEDKKIVFVGDLHIAPENLPRQVHKALGKADVPKKVHFLYQNTEKIYMRLDEEQLEDKDEYVRLDENSFCLNN